jgi:hypothetical protein
MSRCAILALRRRADEERFRNGKAREISGQTMTIRTKSIALIVLAVVVLLAAVQFGPAVLSGLSHN